MKVVVETTVKAPVGKVWSAYTSPDDIRQWNAASDDWHTTRASVDLRVGGEFSSRMEAKDGSFGFDFAGTYTRRLRTLLAIAPAWSSSLRQRAAPRCASPSMPRRKTLSTCSARAGRRS